MLTRLAFTVLVVLLSARVAFAQCPALTGTTYWGPPGGAEWNQRERDQGSGAQ